MTVSAPNPGAESQGPAGAGGAGTVVYIAGAAALYFAPALIVVGWLLARGWKPSYDPREFKALTFRAGVNWGDQLSPINQASDLTVILTDGLGHSSGVTVGAHTGALFYPPGEVNPVPKLFLNTVRIPLAAFSGVNLADVRRVAFRFDQRSTGALLISDVAFADADTALLQ